ncbi:MAG: potassium transporter TrkG [Lachnospiraceae bacterium]|nr:potassium transporter TrkG [Lachnospiraceae bacterium]
MPGEKAPGRFGKPIKPRRRHISSFRIITYGFALTILAGALLLMLPISYRGEHGLSFLDSMFTATSAVCVTGLVVRDTAQTWTVFGQAVILLLIQIGGLGVVTVAAAVAILSGKKIGLIQRSTLQDAISAHHVGGVVKLVAFTLRITFLFEAVGAVLLSLRFVPMYGPAKGIWFGIFHSISAFCNAGFDLMGGSGAFSSLTNFAGDPLVNVVIMTLIVWGGLGFLTWEDLKTNRLNFRRYRMQTKTILTVTVLLILLPAIFFFFGELTGLPLRQRLLGALFQSVTTRTAGFNTLDLTRLSETGLMLMIILMMIGGSPGSTAGGMKTTTLAVLLSSAFAVFRRQEYGAMYKRRISSETVHNAAAILNMYLILGVGAAMMICRLEGLPFMTCLFETASAIGTVGLTLGITSGLGSMSKVILMVLMYFGRVGGLTLIFAAFMGQKKRGQLPEEKITVG